MYCSYPQVIPNSASSVNYQSGTFSVLCRYTNSKTLQALQFFCKSCNCFYWFTVSIPIQYTKCSRLIVYRWCTVQYNLRITAVHCSKLRPFKQIIIIHFFARVFSECTEAVATSLIPLVTNFLEICAFIIGFSFTVWTKKSLEKNTETSNRMLTKFVSIGSYSPEVRTFGTLITST